MTTAEPMTLAELRKAINASVFGTPAEEIPRMQRTVDNLEAIREEIERDYELACRRARNPAADALLGVKVPVLSDGYIMPVDYMGTDDEIVAAARKSYGKGTSKKRDGRGLLRFLLRKWHTTPFEMCELKIAVKVPMDTWRQWIRHRTASVNEYSTRYSLALGNDVTDPDAWRLQDGSNRQGSDGFLDADAGARFSESEARFLDFARELYEERIEAGIAREQARKDLPLSTYTEAVWKIDAHNLLHFLRLRLDSHAQLEIRLFAQAVSDFVKVWLPHTWEAFEDYRLNTVTFTAPEVEAIGQFLAVFEGATAVILEGAFEHRLSKRERVEFVEKLKRLKPAREWRHVAPETAEFSGNAKLKL